MKDCKGNELKVGDKVVFVRGRKTDISLEVGYVSKIYPHGEACSVDNRPHITSRKIMKI